MSSYFCRSGTCQLSFRQLYELRKNVSEWIVNAIKQGLKIRYGQLRLFGKPGSQEKEMWSIHRFFLWTIKDIKLATIGPHWGKDVLRSQEEAIDVTLHHDPSDRELIMAQLQTPPPNLPSIRLELLNDILRVWYKTSS
ncbi:MAG: hypothetical protein NTY61_01370 [Candidatus Parcubacteria bacterium]|nr:hypothetical protein [Candidatus Parcubacteria bacterium]